MFYKSIILHLNIIVLHHSTQKNSKRKNTYAWKRQQYLQAIFSEEGKIKGYP